MMISTNAPRGASENQEDPNGSQSVNKPELLINGALLAKINEIVTAQKDQEMLQLLKEKRVTDKLEACLLYYKLEEGNSDTIEQAVGALNTKFAKKEPLSDNMKEMVLKPFALACSLQANTAFEILDAFFMVDYRKFYHFEQVNQRISDFMRQIQQNLPSQGGNLAIQVQQRQQQYEAYHQELQRVAAIIVTGVKSFYLQERGNLLRCLVNLLGFMSRSSSPPAIRDFFTNKLVQKNLAVNLAKSLLRCQDSFNNEFRRYFDSDSSKSASEALALAIQEEQIELLKLLFSIFYTHEEVINNSVIDTVIQYLVQSCQINYLTAHAMSHLPQFTANDSIIAGLTQLVCFAMLKLHHTILKKGDNKQVITPQIPHAWNLLMNPENLSLVTGPIILAVISDTIVNDKVVQNMKKNLEDSKLLVATTDLLRSEVFHCNMLQSMNDAFYLMIYGWLNKAHRFFERAQLAIEVDQVQMLTLSVLGNPSIVKLIWSELDDQQNNMNDVSKKIEIFKIFLENPILNSQKFLMLVLVLSGNKNERKGTSVMELLQNTKINAEGADSNLLIELIVYLSSQISPLEQKRLDQDEYSMIESILVLFAKVIKQDPLQYARLNDICIQVPEMQQSNQLGYIFEKSDFKQQQVRNKSSLYQGLGHIEFEPGNHPFLSLLVRAFHSLMLVNFQFSRKPVIHLMNAITSLYNSDELFLKQEIVFQLNGYVNHEIGGSMIVSYFGSIVLDEEYSLKNYKATESFLRFLSKVVKSSYPHECQHPEGLQNFDQSIIIHALRQTYFKCMSQYFNVAFADAASMGTFTARCLKLTRHLLDHFLEVPQSQKAPLCEPLPRFDMFLEFVTELLDQFSVEQICIKALQLIQVEDRRSDGSVTTQFENKFLNEAIQTRQGSSNSTKKLIKMTNEALLVLNKLLKLALVDDSPEDTQSLSRSSSGSYLAESSRIVQDWSSKRCKYIRDLRCVQQFRSQILDPTRVLQSAENKSYGHAVNLSLQSMIAYYICPGAKLENSQMKTNALDHLTLTCKLWQQSLLEIVRPDLYQLLQGLGSSTQVEQLFFQQLVLAFTDKLWTLPICLAFLDLLIVSAQSQQGFLEMLLKEEPSKKRALAKLCESIVSIIQNRDAREDVLQDQQKLHIKFKFTVLLSLLAMKRLCIEFVNYKEGTFLQCVMQHIIEEECLKRVMQEKIQLNGKFLQPVMKLDEDYQQKSAIFRLKTRQATNQCLAKVTVCSFLQLIVSEFSRDPTQGTVRALITRIFTNELFTALSLSNGQISSDVHQLMNLTRNLNELLQTDQERNTDSQRRNHDLILGRGIASLQDQMTSPLYSRHKSVFLKGSLCIDLFRVLEKRQLPEFIVNPGADLLDVKSSFGHLGCSLYVSTKELEYVMHQEFYENKMLIAQAVALNSEFNVALSVMLTDYMVLKAKQDFMISVGKIALRDSQSHGKAEQLVPMSFLPLINKEVALSTNQDTFNKLSTQLSMSMIKQAQTILAQIQQRRRSISLQEQKSNMGFHSILPQSYFLTQLDQALLTQLVFTLGVISSQVSAITDFLQVNVKADIEKLVQHEILMQIQNLVDFDDSQFDSGIIAQELNGTGRFGDQTAAIDTAKANSAIQTSERERYDMFIQLVTQCFQLCIRLKQDDILKQGGLRSKPNFFSGDQVNRAQLLERQRLDDAYIKVLAHVLNGMRRNYCFLNGVKVFVLAVQLIEGKNHGGGLSSLMKRQEDQPMKVIISMLLEKDVTQDEITTILQLLINYAMTKEGAIHMSKIQILESLFKANIMQRLNEQDLYVSKQLKNQQGQTSVQQVRNPSHIHWCQVLVLIRTLNDTLLENPQVEHENYFSDLVLQMHHFKQRIPKVLHIGLSLEAQVMQQTDQLGCRSIISMALLEEIELICGVMQQVFEHADYWAQLDFNAYTELKDYTLFAIPKLLQHCNTASIIPASVTEQHLAKVSQSLIENNQTNLLAGNLADSQRSEMSGFELKAEICLQKTFFSVTSSLLNILLLCKKLVQQGKISAISGRADLLETWHLYSSKNFYQQSTVHQSLTGKQTSGVFSDAWMNGQLDLPIIALAFEVVQACQERMMRRYAILRTHYEKKEIQSLYKYLQNVFHHDEWIMKEYSGGFNSHMFADVNGFEDLLDLTETALQVSAQVSALLLEKVRENTSEMRFESNAPSSWHFSAYTDEQQVVFMANDLLKYLKDISREVKQSGPQVASRSSQLDEDRDKQVLDRHYLDKLLQYVQLVKEVPGVGGGSQNQ